MKGKIEIDEIPESCSGCYFSVQVDENNELVYNCVAKGINHVGFVNRRPTWCPIEEVED